MLARSTLCKHRECKKLHGAETWKSRCYPVQSATECLPQQSWRNAPWFAPPAFNFAIFSGPAPRLFWSAPVYVHVYMFESFERALRWRGKKYSDVITSNVYWCSLDMPLYSPSLYRPCFAFLLWLLNQSLRSFPSKRSHHWFPMKLGMLILQDKEILKTQQKRVHRSCFHATMLTNIVIKVTFGDFRAQQINAIIFQCGVLYQTEFDFLWLFIHLRPRKKWLQIPCIIN